MHRGWPTSRQILCFCQQLVQLGGSSVTPSKGSNPKADTVGWHLVSIYFKRVMLDSHFINHPIVKLAPSPSLMNQFVDKGEFYLPSP